jgi:hypothetical protein
MPDRVSSGTLDSRARTKLPVALACLAVLTPLLLVIAGAIDVPGRMPALPLVHAARAEEAPPSPLATGSPEGAARLTAPPTARLTAPPTAEPRERADRHLVRSWRAPLAGGLLTFPPSFASEDGLYDLVLHLNGNTDLVEESYGYAGVNAVVVILNLGVGSGVYEDRFADPAAFSLIVERAQAVMVERGLRGAHLGRLALSAWSSGYGGVVTLLGHEAVFDRIDAVLLLDAIHCGYDNSWPRRLKSWQIDPLRRFAARAVDGRALLSITHSEIETYGYLNAHRTTDLVLESVGVPRVPTASAQPMPVLATMVGVLPRAQMVPLPPRTEAHRGGLHVRGYAGNGPVTHMLHLVQMSTTALPDLVERWGR